MEDSNIGAENMTEKKRTFKEACISDKTCAKDSISFPLFLPPSLST